MTIFSWTRFTSLCFVAASVACATMATAIETKLETYQDEAGQTFFTLTAPAIEANAGSPRDVVILLDTSASQAGFYRDTALAAMRSCIASLGADDRVQVMAADLDTRSINASLAAPVSDEIATALDQLDVEPPLGSTDMELALMTASDAFDGNSSRARTVVYIGDGMSPVNLLETKGFAALVERLRSENISVNSYAVGPQRDTSLLAALANQTGGNLYIDENMTWGNEAEGITDKRAKEENQRRGRKVGETLANWVRAEVINPQSTEWPEAVAEAYPKQLPPMRSDRDSVVVGVLNEGASLDDAQVTAATSAGNTITWEATETIATTDLSFLPQLIEQAEANGGLALTTLGSKGLQETGRMLLASVDQLTNLAERAISIGDREGATRIVQTVLKRDPGNLRAQTVQELINRGGLVDSPAAGAPPQPVADQSVVVEGGFTAEGDLNMVRPAPSTGTVVGPSSGEFIGGVPARDAVVDGSFLTEVERRNRIFSEMLEKEVELAISDARDNMSSNPEATSQDLKLMLENVRGAPQLIPEVRAQLVDRLQTVLQETARSAAVAAEMRLESEERQAAARELRLLNARLDRRIEKENQLVARLNALMDERRYEEAQEVADILEEVDPDGVTPVVAELWSRFDRYHYMQEITRERRHRAAWETFMQVEYSAIPFPDDPPIVYPEAEVWEDLTNRREKYKAVDLAGQDGAEQAITKALSNPLNNLGLSFQDTPLSEAVDFLRNEYNIEVQLDQPALEDLGISADDPIDVELRNISLRSALRIMLKQLDLTYVIADEVLLITSEEEALTRLQVKVYPVADLVLPIETPQPGGIGGGGGGQQGGGGGLGGGGGGGLGGGGGGGFGGGGGGQFSVPEVAEPVVAEISEPAPQASQPASATEAAPEASESQTATQTWDSFFENEVRDSAIVRGEVRKLMKNGAYGEVTTLIQSALRHGQPQPWMYEALGIAMQMDGSDKAAIERAVMSAADFSRSADELAYIASYLTKLDLNRRALQLYKQVLKLDPLRSDAYALGLRAAQRADDSEGVRWATVGILEQAWPADQEVVKETAWRVAKATIEQLVKSGNKEEAKAYKQDIARAIERDCVVRVSWTGDADVDIAVQEPGGSVCSAAEPRAAGGGVNLGDVFTGVEGQQGGVFSETYVCPKGFAGDYRVKVTPVWGEVAAGKVTVDVYLHLNGKKVEHKREQLDLGPDGLAVDFTLDAGRRTEPLEEQHIARAVERQQAVSKAVLAQQIGSLSDPRLAPLRPDARQARRRQLLQGGGEVGFQPVIVTLPEGTNFYATGVVSADRRYVRITSVPFFSIIGDVSTFTFAGAGAQVEDDEDDGGADNGAVGAAF